MYLAERSKLIDTENAFKIGPYIREVEDSGHRVIKCNLGEPDFPVPEHIREEVKRQIDLDNAHYVDPQGILPLRKAVATYLSDTRGIKITPERVVVYPGAKPPIGFSIQTYTNPGDEVVYPSPGFPIYESFIRYCEAAPKPVHLREEAGFTITGKELAAQLSDRTRLIFLNFPSNPTGGVASEDQLRDLADAIVHHAPAGARVFSDEIYEKILFEGAKHHSVASLPGMAERTIIVSGASKSYSWTGGRIGWAAYPTEEEAQIAKNLNINYFSCTAPYNQEGARVGIESPKTQGYIDKMNQAFQERRDVVVGGLNAIPGIRCQKPLGAFYVFPNIGGVCESIGAVAAHRELPEAIRQKSSPSTLFQMFLLFRYQVATMDRKSFGKFGTEGMHYLRLSIATGLADLKEAVARIGRAASDNAGFAKFVAEGKHLS